MRHFFILAFSLLCIAQFGANAQMTDGQVTDYVKSSLSAGKSQSQIGKELLARGVTEKQVERIKARYEANQAEGTSVTSDAVDRSLGQRTQSATSIVTEGATVEDAAQIVQSGSGRNANTIFGHNVFNSRALSFEPNENLPTPENYKLGPGDEVVVEVWGYNEASFSQVISPEGRIVISQIGPVALNGLTIKQADAKIKRLLASKYSGLGDDESKSSVTLGRIRSIQVNIMGEVNTPGTYRLSSFSTVFHALYRAGGVTQTGTMRAIKLIRGGKLVTEMDVYGYLFDGKSDTDVSLQDGDIIMVDPYLNLVEIDGKVKRPMRYELKGGETLQTLIDYAGGFTSDAYTDDINITRYTGKENELYTIKQELFSSYVLSDGDKVDVGAGLERFANRIEIRGYVFRPGMYQLGNEISTISQLIARAEGPTEDAFLDRAIILREKEDLSLESVSIDLGKILSGSAADVALKKNDVVVVSGIHEIQDRGTISINGMVTNPGTFAYTENTTVEDLILRAGGLRYGASTSKIVIARSKFDPTSETIPEESVELITFSMENGYSMDQAQKFILEPFDIVSVRPSPSYQSMERVSISGEVIFPGSYVLVTKNDRISTLIERAGGLTNYANVRGVKLLRNNNNNNIDINEIIRKSSQRDTVDVSTLRLGQDYLVALDLDKALANPGSEYDVILQEGDRVIIPQQDNTIRVIGEVMFPNAVSYVPGKNIRYYIDMAGGYSFDAKRNRAYIIYANGSASRSGLASAKLEPGAMIIVPAKPQKQKTSVAEMATIASTTTSVASLVALIANLFVKR